MQKNNPFALPKKLVMNVTGDELNITFETVTKYIKKHESRLNRYNYLNKLYEGFQMILDEPKKDEWKPDNRLIVNFPRTITEDALGYGYSIPIKKVTEDKELQDSIDKFSKINSLEDHEYELAKMCCKFGHAWEYFYQDENSKTRVTRCTPMELFVVYDDTMQHRALFAVRYGYHSTDSDVSCGEIYGEVLTREWIRQFEGTKFIEGQKQNPYGYIPVVEWVLNEERMGLYEPAAALIEAFSETIGMKKNDVDAFAEAYMVIIGAEVGDDGVKRIHDQRLINIWGTDNSDEIKDTMVQFLQKPTADGTQENLLTRLEDLIYKICMVPNINDEMFGNATSGIALAYKLKPLDNLTGTFNRKITKSLQKRYKIFCTLAVNSKSPDAWTDIDFKFTKNIPHNITEEVTNARNLEGVVSKKTQLGVLSIVENVQDEIDAMDKEQNVQHDNVVSGLFKKQDDEYDSKSQKDAALQQNQGVAKKLKA